MKKEKQKSNSSDKIRYPVCGFRLSVDTKELLDRLKRDSNKSWNRFFLEIINTYEEKTYKEKDV